VANTLRSFPLLGSPAIPSPHRTLSDAVAFTGWRALSPFRAVPACVSPRCASRASTSGPSSTEESVAATQRFRCAPPDAPMGFGSNTFPMLPRRFYRALPSLMVAGQIALRFQLASASPDPRVGGEAKSLGFVWLRTTDVCCAPEGVRPAGPSSLAARRLLRFRSRSTIPRRERSRSVAIGSDAFPKEGTSAAHHPDPEGPSGAPVVNPKEVHRAGPFHPKVLGLRPIASPSRRKVSRPSAKPRRAGTGGSSSHRSSFCGRPHT
jgi:hypothetical protein